MSGIQFETIDWKGTELILLDQRRLPTEETYVTCRTYDDVAKAIEDMVVRGAPAIGITAAYGVVLGLLSLKSDDRITPRTAFETMVERLANTRPTAVNLFWALDRMRCVVEAHLNSMDLNQALEVARREAVAIHREDREMCAAMGRHGAALMGAHISLLTHCNTGALATGGAGTALAVIRELAHQKRLKGVYAGETRPFLQGARLTAWELARDGLPVTVITDNMAADFMRRGMIDAVVVGADRIAANGDTANKIGTYGLAVLCAAHDIPFYVVAPTTTIDPSTLSGEQIEIEQRNSREVTHVGIQQIVPAGVTVANPAFDVAPAKLITAIVTENGVHRPPYAFAATA